VRVLGDGKPQLNVHGERIAFVHPKDFLGALVELEEHKKLTALEPEQTMSGRLRFALLAVLLSPTLTAAAQSYPTRPIRVIVPSQAGGGADIVARMVGQKLTERWSQPVIVDNRIGVVGAETAAHAPADGYTVLFTTSALVVRESVYRKLSYSTLRDFMPVTQVLSQSNLLVVHPSVPARTVQELVALAKARPGELNFGTGGKRHVEPSRRRAARHHDRHQRRACTV